MTITASTPIRRRINFRWRVVDIVIAAVLAVASGVAFWGWDAAWTPLSRPLDALLPGLDSLLGGVWLFPAVLVALVVRKPGAALFAELVAATVEALLGTYWGASTLLSGLIQGLGAEIVFALFLYLSWRLGTAILAGAGAGLALAILDLIVSYPGSKPEFFVIYLVGSIISGAVIAGFLSWLMVRALAKTGVLNRFAAGRSFTTLV
ncbi:MAG: energy-coupling factor transport system permease protein [Actinomycetota bacterium]|nr:energy-coupling factor transport system permease protein [Actinomycetota bacterium]